MIELRDALDRTRLLMRDELRSETPDVVLHEALTATSIALVADAWTLASPAAQTSFITTALLCARSGHMVYLLAPDLRLAGIQPPLTGKYLIDALMNFDGRIVPAHRFTVESPSRAVDLEVRFGATPSACSSHSHLTVSATAWGAHLSTRNGFFPWPSALVWPLGAMAAAALASAEAFKCAMRRLSSFARDPQFFEEFFRAIAYVTLELAPPGTPMVNDLGSFDLISGGAITNGVLYALSRVPGGCGVARVIEPDIADVTNLNRYMLLLIDGLNEAKAEHLAGLDLGGLSLSPMRRRFNTKDSLGTLADRVLMGVDHVPTRWAVQSAQPRWLGIGATTHWSAMASSHRAGVSCAGCAHPRDDDATGPIPTVAFVSFMAALLQTTSFLRQLADAETGDEQGFLTVPRPERIWRSGIPRHPACPVGHSRALAA